MVAKTVKEILRYDSILIFCHTRPDGDTLGSACALYRALTRFGKTADVICPDAVPEKFSFLGIDKIVKKASDLTREYDLHVAVDCSTENMLGDNYPLFVKRNNTVCIDHHISNSKYAKLNLVRDTAACAEIMYEVITETPVSLDKETADFLMLGISTDTGNFAHNNVTENTLLVASKLKACGADLHLIQYEMYKRQSKQRAKLFASVMSKMQFYHDDRLAIIYVRQADLDALDVKSSVTEGFIDFPLSVDGVEVAVSILESGDKKFKISFRSKDKVDVNRIAGLFGGGGHVQASGCMINGYFDDVLDKLVFTVGNYLD